MALTHATGPFKGLPKAAIGPDESVSLETCRSRSGHCPKNLSSAAKDAATRPREESHPKMREKQKAVKLQRDPQD